MEGHKWRKAVAAVGRWSKRLEQPLVGGVISKHLPVTARITRLAVILPAPGVMQKWGRFVLDAGAGKQMAGLNADP